MLPADCGEISRLIYSRRHYSPENGRVHFAAFMPSAKEASPQLSILCIENLEQQAIWDLGAEADAHRSDGRLYKARADRAGTFIESLGLSIDRNNHPFQRHGNILGWPDGLLQQQQLATDLAKTASPIARPS